MILINGCSFTRGEESPVAWPDLIPDSLNIATSGASNDHIFTSTIHQVERQRPDQVIIAWTSPNRIDLSGKHLTPSSQKRYGVVVDWVFRDWDPTWAKQKFLSQIMAMDAYLTQRDIPHVFVSAFDIQTMVDDIDPHPSCYLGWPDSGLVEWMGDCDKGPHGHPSSQGHQRIAEKINEHIRYLGWVS